MALMSCTTMSFFDSRPMSRRAEASAYVRLFVVSIEAGAHGGLRAAWGVAAPAPPANTTVSAAQRAGACGYGCGAGCGCRTWRLPHAGAGMPAPAAAPMAPAGGCGRWRTDATAVGTASGRMLSR